MKFSVWMLAAVCGVVGSASVAHAGDATEGKKIFEQVCSHCHNSTGDEKIGPGLAGITERRSVEWIDAWLKDPAELIKTDDYAKKLRETNKYGMVMPAMPIMRDDTKRANVIAFLETLK